MSGQTVTACYSTPRLGLSLYSKSPKALLRARLPSTRLIKTECPAFPILYCSSLLSGLWSSLNPTATPLLERAARLSPELAQKMWFVVIKTTHDVEPQFWQSSYLFNNSSRSINAYLNAYSYFWSLNACNSVNVSVKCCFAYNDTAFPPCPSNTQKSAPIDPSGSLMLVLMWASSMSILHPYISLAPQLQKSLEPFSDILSLFGAFRNAPIL